MAPFRWCSPGLSSEPLCLPGRDWLVVDVETTGLDPERNRLTEVGVVVLDHRVRVMERFSWSERQTDSELTRLLDRLGARIATSVVVAHNAAFDLAFLKARAEAAGQRLGPVLRWLCTMALTGRRTPLDELARAVDVVIARRHDAKADADILSLVLAKLVAVAADRRLLNVAGLAVVCPIVLHGQRIPDGRDGDAEKGWADVRAALDHVVPCRLPLRHQRRAFHSVAHLAAAGVAGPDDLASAARALRAAGITAAMLDRLLEEELSGPHRG